MSIRMRFRFLILLFVIFSYSCNHHNNYLDEIENTFGVDLSNQVSNEFVDEQWIYFIGDGYRMVVYDITNKSKINLLTNKMSEYDSAYIEDFFRPSELYSYLSNSYGYYFGKKQGDDLYYLFYNVKWGKIIYFHSIM